MHPKTKIDAPRAPRSCSASRGLPAARSRLEDRRRAAAMVTPEARKSGDIGFASLRGGTVTGDHSVIFAGPHERITLSHHAETG